MTNPTDPKHSLAPVIPIGSARKRAEAQREAELERRVAERWTGQVDPGWLREGIQQARDDAEADTTLRERVRQHPSVMIGEDDD